MFTTLFEANGLLEAPRPDSVGRVLFSNVTAGGVFRFRDGIVEEVLPARRGIGGIAPHAEGGLVVTGRDVSYAGTGGVTTLLTIVGATGFNDVTVAPDGSLVVGVLRHRPQQGEAAVPSEVVRIDANGETSTLADDLMWPNGMAYAPDGETLYVSEYAASRIRAIRDGESYVFAHAPRGECDGLTVDAEGGVWVALGSGGGIARFTPDGELDSVLDIPGSFVSSLAFADSTLYVTTVGALLTGSPGVAGLPLPQARIPV